MGKRGEDKKVREVKKGEDWGRLNRVEKFFDLIISDLMHLQTIVNKSL